MPDYVNAVFWWEADQILTMFLNLNRRVSRYFSDVQNLTNLDAVKDEAFMTSKVRWRICISSPSLIATRLERMQGRLSVKMGRSAMF